MADVNARFEKFRADHPDFEGKTAIMAYGGSDGYGAYSTQDTRSRFLSDVGFKTPTEVDKLAGDSFFAEFSPEHFRLMDQDVVSCTARATTSSPTRSSGAWTPSRRIA